MEEKYERNDHGILVFGIIGTICYGLIVFMLFAGCATYVGSYDAGDAGVDGKADSCFMIDPICNQ